MELLQEKTRDKKQETRNKKQKTMNLREAGAAQEIVTGEFEVQSSR